MVAMMSAFKFRIAQIIQDLTTDYPDLLFVEVVEAREFPAGSRFFEVINHHWISSRVRTGNAEMFWIFRVFLGYCFAETGCGVGLFVEDLSIAPAKLGL